MQMPVCSFSIVFITTDMFCCTSEFFDFSLVFYLASKEIVLRRSMIERRRILTERMTEIQNRIMLSETKEIHVNNLRFNC